MRVVRHIARHPLNRHGRLLAFRRLLAWQMGSRLVDGPVAVPFVNDTRLLLSNGMHGGTSNIYCGLHEYADMAFVMHALRSDDLFVDVGANIGSYTVLAAGAVGARSISIEPVPVTYGHLLDNIHLNRLTDRVTAHNVAVGRERGELSITADAAAATNHVIPGHAEDGQGVSVPVVPLDEIVADRPTMVKIDVEGWETPVLDGASALLTADGPLAVLVELNGLGARYGFSDEGITVTLSGLGFVSYTYDPIKRRLTKEDGDFPREDGNTLFIKEAEQFQDRVAEASSFLVLGQEL